jgi:hypothetical protein
MNLYSISNQNYIAMRKIRLFALASLLTGSLGAQNFQHVYGSTQSEHLESGVNVNMLQPVQGHIMAGYTDYPGINTLMVTKTDLNGRFAVLPVFNNNYPIFDATGQQMDAKGRRVIQPQQLGGRILVWGDYTNNPGAMSDKFFLALINPNGTPGAIWGYALPFPVVEAEATSMFYSTSQANTVFVCGFIRQTTAGQRMPIVMSINTGTGVMNWPYIYQDQSGNEIVPMDIVESPYVNSAGARFLALTGHYTRPGFPECGFFWLLPIAGVPGGYLVEYGTPFNGNPGAFEAIDIANNPGNIGQRGFVLGGYYNNPNSGTDDMWAMKIDQTGFLVDFSTVIDYTPGGNTKEYGFDIIERRNTLPPPMNYEYYIGGYVDNGVFGGEDVVVNKLDFTGAPFGGSQFTYGGGGNERASQLDQYNIFPWNNNGLSTFATTDGSFPLLGNPDFYFIKSYFNGVQTPSCPYQLQTPPWTQGPGVIERWEPRDIDKLKKATLSFSRSSMMDWEICWAPNDPGGNNSRLAATASTLEQPGYFPNPVSRENGLVTVTFGKEVLEGIAQVELRNALGQIVWTKQIALADGQTNLQIELGNELNGGMYHLTVRQNGTLNNYRILVQ